MTNQDKPAGTPPAPSIEVVREIPQIWIIIVDTPDGKGYVAFNSRTSSFYIEARRFLAARFKKEDAEKVVDACVKQGYSRDNFYIKHPLEI